MDRAAGNARNSQPWWHAAPTILATLTAAVSLLLSACATQEKAAFTLGYDLPEETRRQVWPAAATREVPRYVYLGKIRGDENFPQPKAENGLRSVFEALVGLVAGESAPRHLDRPQSGVVDESGRVLVTDLGRSAVYVFDENGSRLDIWEQADGARGFVAPVGIALGPEGETFVADAELALVARLDRQGNSGAAIGKGVLSRPNGIAVDLTTRRIFVVDTHAHQIKVFDLEGNLLEVWGKRGDGPGEFNYPTHVALRGERLYVSDTLNARIEVLSAHDGRPLASIGKRGLFFGNLVRPKGVATDSEENIYVIESYYDQMLVFNRKGQFLMSIGGVGTGAGRFHLPSGVWLDARNRVFIADTLNGRVPVFQFLGGGAENE